MPFTGNSSDSSDGETELGEARGNKSSMTNMTSSSACSADMTLSSPRQTDTLMLSPRKSTGSSLGAHSVSPSPLLFSNANTPCLTVTKHSNFAYKCQGGLPGGLPASPTASPGSIFPQMKGGFGGKMRKSRKEYTARLLALKRQPTRAVHPSVCIQKI